MLSQITGAVEAAASAAKNKLHKPDTSQYSGDHAHYDTSTGQWVTTPAGSSAPVCTQSGYGYSQSLSGHSQQLTAPMTPIGNQGQWSDGFSGSSGYLAPGPSAAPYGTSPVGQWSGAANGFSGYPVSITSVAPYGTSPVNPAPSNYGGQSPSVHPHGPSPYSYTPSTASGPQGPYDPNALQGQQYTTQKPPPVNPYYQDQYVPPPAQTEQYGQSPPPVPYNQYVQPPPPTPYNQHGQQPPPPAGYPSQQYPSSGCGGNGYQ